jgi:hypothetical protein
LWVAGCNGLPEEKFVAQLLTEETRKEQDRAKTQILADLKDASKVEILRVASNRRTSGEPPDPTVSTILGYKIVARGETVDRSEIASMANSLAREISAMKYEIRLMCYNPHHALRYTNGLQTHIILVCFECGRGDVWMKGRSEAEINYREDEVLSFLFDGNESERIFESVFSKHGLLGKPAK